MVEKVHLLKLEQKKEIENRKKLIIFQYIALKEIVDTMKVSFLLPGI